jgi:predicted AlkP superfamily phosphohydrolase/phosphomutase
MSFRIFGWRPALAIVLVAALAVPLAGLGACGKAAAKGPEVIVLGFDGMDYGLTRRMMEEGRLPNFSRLAAEGGFSPLMSSVPPQSPVAWSTFVTGLDPGSHGIYDFVHRDAETMLPYLSTSRTVAPSWNLSFGRWQVPLVGGRVELLREGEAFWEELERRGVETTIIRMPANFPPSGSATRELSGMGTPDLLGTYGTFSYYTSEPFASINVTLSGGEVHDVTVRNGVVRAALYGPDNPFLKEPTKVSADFTVFVDPEAPVAKLVVGGEERMLEVGEWSDWVPVEFPLAPLQNLRGMCRFYLKQLQPEFELYVSPINLDPLSPALPISTPAGYAAELANATGRFYTQGMPEDTKSLSDRILSRDEFLAQARLAAAELRAQYRYVLDRFDGGLLFYYFGTGDQVSHMMWRPMDPEHPAYDPVADAPYRHVVEDIYVDFDTIVGETLARMPKDALLVVMSDHGFSSWRRVFHLNSWLEQNGYLTVIDPQRREGDLFSNVDWTRTRAYGMGLNGLYINVRGREHAGIVPPEAREALAAEIAAKLVKVIDPATGEQAVTHAYLREQVYHEIRHPEYTPDIIVGYSKHTRVSNESALGAVPQTVFADNRDEWSGDHCMDTEAVPGVLLTSRRLQKPAPSLQTLAAAILAEFGIDDFPRRESSP